MRTRNQLIHYMWTILSKHWLHCWLWIDEKMEIRMMIITILPIMSGEYNSTNRHPNIGNCRDTKFTSGSGRKTPKQLVASLQPGAIYDYLQSQKSRHCHSMMRHVNISKFRSTAHTSGRGRTFFIYFYLFIYFLLEPSTYNSSGVLADLTCNFKFICFPDSVQLILFNRESCEYRKALKHLFG